jgi:DNA-directed RNA polymerase beta subunit
MFPHESRLRNLTYSTELYTDIVFRKKQIEDEYVENQETQQRERKVK